jgi:hypothetical protein
MDRGKKYAFLAVFFIGAYVFVSLVLAHQVGRTSPRLTSLLKPPLFNFNGTYKNGQVLDFGISMSKRDAYEVLVSGNKSKIDSSCWGDFRAGNAGLYYQDQIAKAVMSNSTTCIRYKKGELLVIKTVGDRVTEIQSSYIRTELI